MARSPNDLGATRSRIRRVSRTLERRYPVRWVLAAPALLLLAISVALPILLTILLSLTDAGLAGDLPDFIGFDNYLFQAIFNDRFYGAIFTTVVFMIGAVFSQFILGFGFALLLWGQKKRRKLFLTPLLAPMFITWVAVGLIFRFIFNQEFGIVPHLLGFIGLGNVPWLSDPTFALVTIVIADTWQWTPFIMILILAGLESLPKAPHEAAKTDGASDVEVFKDVTLPLMKPVLAIALFIRTIEASKLFPKVITMTNGGPGTATESISYLIYKTAFTNFQIAPAASQAVSATLMILGFALVYWWLQVRGENYGR